MAVQLLPQAAHPPDRLLKGGLSEPTQLWRSPCIVATLARPYRDFSLDYGIQEAHSAEEEHPTLHSTSVENQHLLQQYGLSQHTQNPFLQQPSPVQAVPQHGLATHPSLMQVSAVEEHHDLRQPHMLRHQTHIPHHQPAYGSGPSHMHYGHHGRKRSRPHDDLQLDLQGLAGLPGIGESTTDLGVELTAQGRHGPPHQGLFQPTNTQSLSSAQHHHHRLPNQPPPHKLQRFTSPPSQHQGPPSMVGQDGMPPPAPRPRGPKLKFTPEDDQLLVDLKEKKNLTWKQIADFFPGRSSGTLQVRYCTKLKAKATVWTDEMVSRLCSVFTPMLGCEPSMDVLQAHATPSGCHARGFAVKKFVSTSSLGTNATRLRCLSFVMLCGNMKMTDGA